MKVLGEESDYTSHSKNVTSAVCGFIGVLIPCE
jgi:hypothetical protein